MTMRRTLLAGVGAAALLGPAAARADMPVLDGANLLNTAKTVEQGAQQIEQLTQQIQTMQQQLATAQQTFASVAHAPANELQSLSQSFNIPALRNVLPTTSGAMGSVLNGTGLGNMGGTSGSLGGTGQQYLSQNRVYQPQGSDFATQQMTTNAASIAGVQAASDQLYQSASTHIATLEGLENQLNDAPDAKAVADIQARVQTEQTYLAAQQVQAQAINTWQQAQTRNVDEQSAEKQRQNIDDVLAQDAATTPGS